MKTLVARCFLIGLICLFFLLRFDQAAFNLFDLSNLSALAQEQSSAGFDSATAADERAPALRGKHFLSAGVQMAWTQQYAARHVSGHDEGRAITSDDEGNTYVTGKGSNIDGLAYITTIKYDNAGAQQWVARYKDGSHQFSAYGAAIAVDNRGQVYIAGTIYEMNNQWGVKFATIKYNALGEMMWVAKYNSPQAGIHSANALTVDEAGNVYVTGSAPGFDSSDRGYLTIKYDAAGRQQWASRYSDSKNLYQAANAIQVDKNGNVYVAGSGFHTIKYDAAGKEVWRRTFKYADYPWNDAAALRLDGMGNVYVAGGSYCCDRGPNHYGEGPFTTVKYNAEGAEQWIAHYSSEKGSYNQASALGLDQSGNVYVTGVSAVSGYLGSEDYATIKYNAKGQEQWVKRYNGAGNSQDHPKALLLDRERNIYVTGVSGSRVGTIKYDSTGAEQWNTRFTGASDGYAYANGMAMDRSGNIYVAGFGLGESGTFDYMTVKYNISGQQQWLAQYDGPPHADNIASALAVDANGNVYVTGTSRKTYPHSFQKYHELSDFATVKYNSAGAQEWVTRYSANHGISEDRASALTIDDSGKIYVAGSSRGYTYLSPSSYSFFTALRYDASGQKMMQARYNNGSFSSPLASRALTVDQQGNIYLVGIGSSYVTVKFNKTGAQEWMAVASYPGTQYNYDFSTAIAVDGAGNVYITGGSSWQGDHYVIIKYTASGQQQWMARNRSNYSYYYPTDLAADNAGNVYVTGYGLNFDKPADYLTIKYNSAGVQQWSATYDGPPNTEIRKTAMVLLGNNIYVTGSSRSARGDMDYATIKYNSNGARQWVARYNSPDNKNDMAIDIAADQAGNIYVTGTSWNGGPGYSDHHGDYITIKYDPAGRQQWVARYNGPNDHHDDVADLAVDQANNVYVTGTSFNKDGRKKVYTTIKYTQTAAAAGLLAAVAEAPAPPANYFLAQNYPNPFWSAATSPAFGGGNPSTTIRYSIAKPGYVTLKIYTLHGQEIATLVNENQAAGAYEAQWHPTATPSGEYLYRLQAGDFSAVKKIILLK